MTKTTTQLPSMTPTKGSPTVTWRQTETDPRRDPPPPQSTPPRGTSKVKQEVKLCNAVRSNWMVLLAYFWSWIQKLINGIHFLFCYIFLWRWTNLHVREYSGEGFEHIYSCSGQSKHFKPFINTFSKDVGVWTGYFGQSSHRLRESAGRVCFWPRRDTDDGKTIPSF